MRALVQRVSEASVSVNGELVGQIRKGLCVFLGVRHSDAIQQAEKLAGKVIDLRIFPDDTGRMNWSLADISGELLVISQFTLYGDSRRGNRPSYSEAAKPEQAKELYEIFVQHCQQRCRKVASGVFQAHMEVRLVNDGPVTIICYSGE
jgi:D-aminoacyl-tRNA deacylase